MKKIPLVKPNFDHDKLAKEVNYIVLNLKQLLER